MKASDFIGELFLARNVAHSVHLYTRSYFKHKALGSFYKDIVELADNFAEVYQGKYGPIGNIPIMGATKTSKIVEFLGNQLEVLEKERCSICPKEYTPLQNIIDEIIGLYLSTLHKLKFLS